MIWNFEVNKYHFVCVIFFFGFLWCIVEYFFHVYVNNAILRIKQSNLTSYFETEGFYVDKCIDFQFDLSIYLLRRLWQI